MIYRRDVDGLRALAVIPVILFHADFEFFQGGFIGVDIFFVISGFIITSIILEEIKNKNFNLLNFYNRRARRILPALFSVLLLCIFFAWILLQPNDLIHFAKSIGGVILFSSNFIFAKKGYFEPDSEKAPLLHTWSLAVEEQYYLLFPLLLIFIKRRSSLILSFLFLGAASLIYSQYQVLNQPHHAFFMMPSRFWELLAGSGVALSLNEAKDECPLAEHRSYWKQFFSLIGLLLIIASFSLIDKDWGFPGIHAIPPVLGAVLILRFSSPKTLTGKILGFKPLASIGLVSYSAYLIHQPILAFVKYQSQDAIEYRDALLIVLITFAIAFVSWRFIESPFRNRNLIPNKLFTAIMLLASFGFLFFYYVVKKNDGFPNRFPSLQSYYADSAWPETYNWDKPCIEKYGGDQYCKVTDINIPVTDALIGDSHSSHFFPGLSDFLKSQGRNLIQQGAGGCPPFLYIDTGLHPSHGNLRCLERTKKIYEEIVASKTINTIYLAFHHSGYFDHFSYPLRDTKNEIPYTDGLDFVSRSLIRSIKTMESAGKSVVLIYDLPDLQDGEPINCLLKESRLGKIGECDRREIFRYDFEKYEKLISQVLSQTGAKVF